MENTIHEQYIPLALYALAAILLGILVITVSSFLGPRFSSKHKFDPYECGMDQMDSPHKPFAVKFYAVALFFMLFDLETIFLLPWAIGFREYGTGALLAMAFFMAVPALGLFYTIRCGALRWE